MFLYKNLFFQYLLFFQSQSCLLESTAAIFRKSAGYVSNWILRIFFCLRIILSGWNCTSLKLIWNKITQESQNFNVLLFFAELTQLHLSMICEMKTFIHLTFLQILILISIFRSYTLDNSCFRFLHLSALILAKNVKLNFVSYCM